MKVRYDREDDVLTLQRTDGVVDHAEDSDGVIAHFSREDRLLLVEVLDASDFLAQLTRTTATARTGEAVEV